MECNYTDDEKRANESAWKRRQKFPVKSRKIWIIFEKFAPPIAPDLFNTNATFPLGFATFNGPMEALLDIQLALSEHAMIAAAYTSNATYKRGNIVLPRW